MSVQLKICGVTRAVDYRACVDAGVDAVGINLWEGSRRHLSVPRTRALLAEVADAGDIVRVGVFVDPAIAWLRQAQSVLALDLLQFHGAAPIEDYAELGYDYVWVIRGTPALDKLELPARRPAWVLLDSQSPGFGGAGTRTDWAWARGVVEKFAPTPVWLAGGITPANAREAISTVRPAGIDVATGAEVEGAPHGEKDPDKIAALVAICHNS